MPFRFRETLFAGLVVGALWLGVATTHAGQATAGLPSEMLDTTWNLVSLQPDGQAAQDVAGGGITILFTAQDAFSGSGGCNSYSGTYEAPGSQALTIKQPIAATLMACEDPAGTREFEYFDALGKVESYTLESATRLQLDLAVDGRLVYESAARSTLPTTGGTGADRGMLLGLAALLLAAGRVARSVQDRRTVRVPSGRGPKHGTARR